MFDLALLFVCVFLLSFKHFDHLALGKRELVFVLIVHFLLAMHTLICVTFSLPPGVGGWLRLLLVAFPGPFCLPFCMSRLLRLCCVESLFRDNSVTSSIPTYFENTESPVICYNKPIRNTILSFSELVSDLDTETNSPNSWEYKESKFCYQPAGHIVIGNLKIISDSRIRSIISKGPKCRFPAHIDFTECREALAKALNDYCTRWCKREHVESNALNNWKLNIFQIIDKLISFYLNNLDLLPPKSKFSFRHSK